jgi:hypothetical protein
MIGMLGYIFICTTAILGYATYNLLIKVEVLEEELLDTIDEVLDVKFKTRKALEEMRDIDSREAFEKDDDVGSVFAGLKEIVEELGEKTNEA